MKLDKLLFPWETIRAKSVYDTVIDTEVNHDVDVYARRDFPSFTIISGCAIGYSTLNKRWYRINQTAHHDGGWMILSKVSYASAALAKARVDVAFSGIGYTFIPEDQVERYKKISLLI